MRGRSASLLLAAMLVVPGMTAGLTRADESWPAQKCAFYAKAWTELLELSGRADITDGFISGNEAFIAAGCSNGADVCPTSKGDIELANQLTVAAMNFGTASSFLPFVCRQPK
jgi:hypothetical protein